MSSSVTEYEEKKRKASRIKRDLSFGEIVDRLGKGDWEFLKDLYFCRCMPLATVVDLYFKKESTDKRRTARDRMGYLHKAGILERSSTDPDEVRKDPRERKNGIMRETWYFLSHRGLRLVETRNRIEDENRLSKNELDLERARKEHFWALAQVYLDLKYNLMPPTVRQFIEWDWHPALTIYGHNDILEVRPDAVLRVLDKVYYIELDRSTEPIRRSPFQKGDPLQVSIVNKLERYKAVLHHSDVSEVQKSGIIAFIVPDAIYDSRLENIRSAASMVFTKHFPTKVLVGRTIHDIMAERWEKAGHVEGDA